MILSDCGTSFLSAVGIGAKESKELNFTLKAPDFSFKLEPESTWRSMVPPQLLARGNKAA